MAHGETGLIVDDPQDVDAAAGAILSLMEDPIRRKEMGVRARARAREEFDYDRQAAKLQAAIDQCRLVNAGGSI